MTTIQIAARDLQAGDIVKKAPGGASYWNGAAVVRTFYRDTDALRRSDRRITVEVAGRKHHMQPLDSAVLTVIRAEAR